MKALLVVFVLVCVSLTAGLVSADNPVGGALPVDVAGLWQEPCCGQAEAEPVPVVEVPCCGNQAVASVDVNTLRALEYGADRPVMMADASPTHSQPLAPEPQPVAEAVQETSNSNAYVATLAEAVLARAEQSDNPVTKGILGLIANLLVLGAYLFGRYQRKG
jgi:hypothetical protein